ncbi:MAG: phenylalanine--tRNA ligase subunit alpha [marine benthic group bacterium]|nr:phenylalanine--tRNA ligase subunit alpha [Candidatus Carthagonibacter metallireducens]
MANEGPALRERLEEIRRRGVAAFESAESQEALEAARIEFLGRGGLVSRAMSDLKALPAEEKPATGQAGNRVKKALEALLEVRSAAIAAAESGETDEVTDLTLPGRRTWQGGVHPVTRVIDEVCEIFREIGFTIATGPEIESDWHNFTSLNIPLDHPAADMHDTFYLDQGVLLRTHTSPVQARIMLEHDPPVRVLAPGLVFRRDPWDASHAPAFEQIEGLAVDEGIDFVEFRAAIDFFVHRFFGTGTRTRFRPSYFPFTEPSAEVDVTCFLCEGSGCSTCKGTGWVEIMGSGMVNPAVFEAVGYDSERFTGYAFGMGPARIALLRYRIPDIRLLYEGDAAFLEQFR